MATEPTGLRPEPRAQARDQGALRRQMVVLAGTLAAFIGIVLVVLVQVIVEDSTTTAVDRVLTDRAAALLSSADAASTGTLLQVPDSRLEPGVVVYDAQGQVVAGAVPPALAEAFTALSDTQTQRRVDVGDTYRLFAQPFTTPAGASGVLVVAEPLAPYEADEAQALWLSVGAVLTLVAVAVALVAWASRRALAPVAEMARTAEEWSAHDLQRRFALGAPTNEIRLLAHTLDGLLDRVGAAILDEQRLSAELAHELRTPLTTMQATAELAASRSDLDERLREDLDDILTGCRAMASSITVLLELARGTSSGWSTAVTPVAHAIQDAVDHRRPQTDGPTVEVDIPTDLYVKAPRAVAARALAPVVDNAVRHGHAIRITAAVTGTGQVRIEVIDDGPGVGRDVIDTLFAPGVSAAEGAGLGLALARRVARTLGGDVTLLRQASPTVFAVTLPSAPAPVPAPDLS